MNVLKKLCGVENYCGIVLATTGWEEVARSQEQMSLACGRHQELLEKDKFWGDIKRAGGQVVPLTAPEIDIENILRHILEKDRKITLSFQHQLVEEKRSIHQTDAGRIVYDAASSPSFCKLEGQLAQTKGNLQKDIACRISKDQEELEHLMASIRNSMDPLESDLARLRTGAGELQATWDEYLQKDFELLQQDVVIDNLHSENSGNNTKAPKEVRWTPQSRECRVDEKLEYSQPHKVNASIARKHKIVKKSPNSNLTAVSVVGAGLAAGQLIAAMACTVM